MMKVERIIHRPRYMTLMISARFNFRSTGFRRRAVPPPPPMLPAPTLPGMSGGIEAPLRALLGWSAGVNLEKPNAFGSSPLREALLPEELSGEVRLANVPRA